MITNIVNSRLMICLLSVLYLTQSALMANSIFLPTDAGSSAQMISKGYIEGFSNGPASVFENPAGLYRSESGGFSFFTTSVIDEVFYKNIGLVSFTPIGRVGFGYYESAVNGLISTTENENSGRYKLAYQYSLSPQFHLGAAYSYYSNTFDDEVGTGSDMDFGLVYDSEDFIISFFSRNLMSSSITYKDDSTSQIESELFASLKYHWDQYSVYYQLKRKENKYLNSYAVDYDLLDNESLVFALGQREYLVLGEIKQSMTFGMELKLLGLNFGTAFEKSDYFENNNKIYWSTGMEF